MEGHRRVTRYVVTCGIRDQEWLRSVFRSMKGFGRQLQLSVYVCDLSALSLAKLKVELVNIVQATEDQVLLVDVGPTDGRGIEVFEAIGGPDPVSADLWERNRLRAPRIERFGGDSPRRGARKSPSAGKDGVYGAGDPHAGRR